MVLHYGKGNGNNSTMGLWCKLGIRGDSDHSFFRKSCQLMDSPKQLTGDNFDISE